jgi:hypothetical protein
MNSFETNPFGVLTFIVAPAMLTNGSSIMALSTSNRYNHAFARLRNLWELVEHGGTTPDSKTAVRLRQLKLAEGKASHLVKALTALYLTVGSFAAASLVSLMGSLFVVLQHETISNAAQAVALYIGVMGVGALMTASIPFVLETRMSVSVRTGTTLC